MKIHEYNQMMAYLTRPAMNIGGRVGYKPGGIVEPGVTHYAKEDFIRNPAGINQKQPLEIKLLLLNLKKLPMLCVNYQLLQD